MGATNSTTYYNLSQFVATDKPAWLQDYNGDMTKIDAGIKGALTAAQSAQSTADSANTDITQLASDVSSLQTTVAGHTSDIGDLSGDVNTIESLIGNGTPTTTDQTIIGAINELHTGLSSVAKIKIITDSSHTQSDVRAGVLIPYPTGMDMSRIMPLQYDITYNNGANILCEGSNAGSTYQQHGMYCDSSGITIINNNIAANNNNVVIRIAYMELA